MAWIEIDSVSDARLDPYRDIRSRNWAEHGGWFIAEGILLVQQLLDSDYECHNVLVDRKYKSLFEGQLLSGLQVLLVDHRLVQEIVGFKFHRGVIACGLRKPAGRLPSGLPRVEPSETLVGLIGVQDPENVGGILRTCAALGIRRVLIGPGCADPFSRRALRVSMGNVLKLEIYRSISPLEDLSWIREQLHVFRYAASPVRDSPVLSNKSLSLAEVHRQGAAIVLFGNERDGLPEEILQIADYRVRIDMHSAVDSLNVCVAAGIILHHFCTH